MKRNQQGITLIGFVLVLAVAGVFIYMGMKLVPMYSEFYAVKQAMKAMSQESGMAESDPQKIKDAFFKRLYTSYSESVKPENVKLVRRDAGWLMTVDYIVTRPLISNLDVVGRFHAEEELKRVGAD